MSGWIASGGRVVETEDLEPFISSQFRGCKDLLEHHGFPRDVGLDVHVWLGGECQLCGPVLVAEVRASAVQADLRLETAVALARHSGASWETIGRAAGMSRQSAHERWRRLDGRTEDPRG